VRVFVYCHIRKDCLSIRALEGSNKGRVIAHAEQLSMRNVSFKVSEAGRQRVLSEGRKNVHAGAVGYIDAAWGLEPRRDDLDYETLKGLGLGGVFRPLSRGTRISYNPRKHATFVQRANNAPVVCTERLWLTRCGKMVASGVGKGM